ncbi:MAG: type I DNA topoisomerase [Ilumatobacteraceae bacterium]|nr:type I DNA topoisomerase [Ilumatobacteraceae bacterium]
MSNALVIVESPAKAKTISKFLGDGFDVRASVGHIADLPSKGLSVDVENSFKPNYELTERGAQVIKELKALLKDADELYLATDEDREGEAIAAHLLEYLKPKIPVKRMVFHEITKTAISEALAHTRDIDYKLVDAAEARRILDRLYGYEVSPILWRKVNRGLSAGRVQSPSIRLVVEREEERMAHVAAGYWDLEATSATTPIFSAGLQSVDGSRIAMGKDFDSLGVVKEGVVVITESKAGELVAGLANVDLEVRSVEDRPYRKSPRAPFMTSTLQQEGGNKLRITASEVMRLAQGLYEGGFITYMRTDNVILGDDAMTAVRSEISNAFGKEFLSAEPRQYKSKVKNAQEAHEAIRPTLPLRSPDVIASEVNARELALYKIIWQRTLASQMSDATGTTVTIKLGANTVGAVKADCEFSTSGTTITFAGYRQAYQEVEEDSESEEKEALLPPMKVGDKVKIDKYSANGHETSPPARYTEPTLVKKLEELGIGRPSTYAAILGTILNRGYVWKKGQAIVPSWTAFAVVKLMKNHFTELVDYAFTATVEEELDEISQGLRVKEVWLGEFYYGNGKELPGLKPLVEHNIANIDAAALNAFPVGMHPTTGEEIVLRPGKFGPYVRCGDNTASVPETMTPDELNVEIAVALLAAPKYIDPIGELDDLPVFLKTGRYGPYVQWGTIENPPPDLEKPKMVSLFKTMALENVTMTEALQLLSLPRTVGADTTDGEIITAQNGRYGPYISKGKESRTLESEDQIFTITIEAALAKLAEPRVFGRRGPAKPPLKEFGNDPVSNRPVVAKDGKFGTYVTDGETNASLTRGDRLEFITPERAFELLAIRRDYTASNGGKKPAKRAAKPKKAAAEKAKAKPKTKPSTKAAKKPAKTAGAKSKSTK